MYIVALLLSPAGLIVCSRKRSFSRGRLKVECRLIVNIIFSLIAGGTGGLHSPPTSRQRNSEPLGRSAKMLPSLFTTTHLGRLSASLNLTMEIFGIGLTASKRTI